MRIATRKREIEILTLIGATRGFIRAPIMYEAINYSVMGVIIGWVAGILIVLYITPTALNYFSGIEILPNDPLMFFGLLGAILVVEFVLWLGIAVFGSV